MSNIDSVWVLLSARAGVYRILQNVLGNEPSTELLEQLSGTDTQNVFLLFDTGQDSYLQSAKSFFAVSAEYLAGGEDALSTLGGRFTRLFVGPGGTEGTPWESFFLNQDKMLRQGVTLEVRKAYVSQGLIPRAYPSVSDDHIAIELDFLTKLAERAEKTLREGDAAQTLEALEASEVFLREHLIKWIHLFTSSLSQAKHGASFYLEAAQVLERFIPIDREAIAEIKKTLQA